MGRGATWTVQVSHFSSDGTPEHTRLALNTHPLREWYDPTNTYTEASGSRGRVPGPAVGQHAWERWRGAAPPHRSDWQRCEHVRIQCAGPAVSTRGAPCGCEQRPARAPVMRRGPDAGERRPRVTGTTTFATLYHTRLSGCPCPLTGTSLHARMNLPHACPPGAPPTMLALLSLPRSLRFHALTMQRAPHVCMPVDAHMFHALL